MSEASIRYSPTERIALTVAANNPEAVTGRTLRDVRVAQAAVELVVEAVYAKFGDQLGLSGEGDPLQEIVNALADTIDPKQTAQYGVPWPASDIS